MLKTKTNSNGRRPQNIKSWISQQPMTGSFSNFELKHRELNWNHMLERKTTTNGNAHKISKIWISQQTQIEFSSNLRLKLRGPIQNQKCLKWRRAPIEEYLKLSKVEYLSNPCSDLLQVLNWGLEDQTKIQNALIEDHLQ